MKCLNLSDLNIKKIVNDFGEQKTSELLDKYFLDKKIPTIDEFVNHLKVAKELNIIPISKVKDEIGKSYPKQISNSQLIDLKKQVSNINNKLKGVVYKLLNIQQVGQADLFTWKLRKLNGNLDLEAKLERAKEQSKNTIESFNRIKKLEDKLKEEKETKEIKKLIEQKEVTNSRNLEYFNGNEILLEQEQNEDNLIQKELDKIVTKINNESRQLDLFESFQNIITNENKPTQIDTTKSDGLLWGEMSSYESETNFKPTESKSQYGSDNSLQERINGRDFKEIWNSNEFTQLERENILLHSIQERMLDKNTFNGELFAGINSKLGKLELRVVDNEKYPFLAFQKQIYINPKTFLKYLQNANIEDVDKYLDLTVSEELIHVLTNYFTSLEDIKKIATEINPNNFKYIQSIYKSLPSGDFELGTREYLRMIVQQEILGTTTEKIKYTKNGVIDSIIDKIWNFLYQIFKDNKGTLAEKVKKHIDFIKSNNVDSTNNYKPDILQVEDSFLNQDIKYQLSKEQSKGIIASEKTIRDLAARMSDRIGIPVRYISDRSQQFKGKLENGTAVINLAYATLDTPIHEILGHPIIRAIKDKKGEHFNTWLQKTKPELFKRFSDKEFDFYSDVNKEFEDFILEITPDYIGEYKQYLDNKQQLYQNLLKELETGRGKEVFEQVKRDYKEKPKVSIKNKSQYQYQDITINGIETSTFNNFTFNFKNKEYYVTRNGSFMEVTPKGAITVKNISNELKQKVQESWDIVEDLIKNGVPQGEYTLEEQQEEAIVELLGLMTAEKLDNVKDGKLISLLKRLLKEMKQFIRSLINQKEIEIDNLPDNLTINDLANILAYSSSKLILPGYEVEYTTPDNMKFKTYQEASNHISDLAKNVKDIDLDNVKLNPNLEKEIQEKRSLLEEQLKQVEDKIREANNELDKLVFIGEKMKSKFEFTNEYKEYLNQYKEFTDNNLTPLRKQEKEIFEKINEIRLEKGMYASSGNTILNFIQKNKEYEQSKEIIEEWKKVNNIKYNPEEIYSRGQEFSSVVGAYSSFDVNLMMQNLLSHIEDNEKAGGKFAISAYTKPVDKQIGHLEGGGGKIKFKIYPQSQDILWAANTDVFSGSVWDASEKVSKDKKSELLGVSYTKYPSLKSINEGSTHLEYLFKQLKIMESFEEKDFKNTTKKTIDWAKGLHKYTNIQKGISFESKENDVEKALLENINNTKELIKEQEKNNKGVQPNLASIIDNLSHHHNELGISLTGNNFRLEYDENIPYSTKKIINSINSILDQKYGKLVKPEINTNNQKIKKYSLEVDAVKQGYFDTKEEAERVGKLAEQTGVDYLIKEVYVQQGIQPTQTASTLKESIEGVWDNYNKTKRYKDSGKIGWRVTNSKGESTDIFTDKTKAENQLKLREDELEEGWFLEKVNIPEEKEYTSQTLINIKIAKLKEVAKKYPRSLIRSEVKRIENYENYVNVSGTKGLFDPDELPFQKIPSFSLSKEQSDAIDNVFDENTELANAVTKEQYREYINSLLTGETISNQAGDLSKSLVKDIVYHGTNNPNFSGFGSDFSRAIHFGTLQAAKDRRSHTDFEFKNNAKFIPVLLNVKNPLKTKQDFNFEGDGLEFVDDPDFDFTKEEGHRLLITYLHNKGYNVYHPKGGVYRDGEILNNAGLDSVIYKNEREDKGNYSYAVFETEQIHIMGSKSDIEQAKEFINKNNQNTKFNISEKSKELSKLPNNQWFNRTIQPIINRFSKMFPNVRSVVISEKEIPNEVKAIVDGLDKQINSFFHKGQVYIIKERVTKDVAIEEFLHPFVNALEQDNPELFKSLLLDAKKLFPELKEEVFTKYGKVYGSIFDLNREFLTQALTKKVSEQTPAQETFFQKFKSWVKDILNRLFGEEAFTRQLSELDEQMSLTDLASILNENNTQFNFNTDTNTTYYSLSEEEVITILNKLKGENVTEKQKELTRLILNNNKETEFIADTHEYFTNNLGEKVALKPVSGFLPKFASDKIFEDFDKIGNVIHDIAKAINVERLTEQQFISKYYENSTLKKFFVEEKGFPDSSAKQIISNIYSYISMIGKDSILISEVSISHLQDIDEEFKGVAGTIDLLEIKKDGSIVIHDFKSMYLNSEEKSSTNKESTEASIKFNQKKKTYELQLSLYKKLLQGIIPENKGIELQIYPIFYLAKKETIGNTIKVVFNDEPSVNIDFKEQQNYIFNAINNLDFLESIKKYKLDYNVKFANEILPTIEEPKAKKVLSKLEIDRNELLEKMTDKLKSDNSKELEREIEKTFKQVTILVKQYGNSENELNKALFKLFDPNNELKDTKNNFEVIFKSLSTLDKDDPVAFKHYLSNLVQYVNFIQEINVSLNNIKDNFLVIKSQTKTDTEKIADYRKSYLLAKSNKDRIGETLLQMKDISEDNLFKQMVRLSISNIEEIENLYYKETLPLIANTIDSYLTPELKQEVNDELTKRLNKIKYDLTLDVSESNRKILLEELELKEKEISIINDPNLISKMIKGEFGDGHWFYSNLVANINNSNYVISGTSLMMQSILKEISIIAIRTQDDLGKEFSKRELVYGVNRDQVKKMNEDLVTTTTRFFENADGTIEELKSMTFITEVDQQVYEDLKKLEILHKNAKTDEEKEKTLKSIKDFKDSHFVSKYNPKYLNILNKIDVKVSDGRNIMEIRNAIFSDINAIKISEGKENYKEGNITEENQKALKELYRKLFNLSSSFDRNGNKKQGADLEIAEILQSRSAELEEFRKKEVDEQTWNKLKTKKIQELLPKYNNEDQVLKSEEYKLWQSFNTVISPTKEFYDERKKILEKINSILDKKEYKDVVLVGQLKDNLNQSWEKLLAISREYRDFEREVMAQDVPDGTKKAMKTLEENIDKIKSQIKVLEKSLSEQDKKALNGLWDEYNSMVEYKNSKYYEEDLENELNKYALENEIELSELKNNKSLLVDFRLNNEWYINNHVRKEKFDVASQEMIVVNEPAYYYKVIIPTNSDFLEESPAMQYNSFELKDEAYNLDKDGKPNYLDVFGRLKVKSNSPYITENLPYLKLKNDLSKKAMVTKENLLKIQEYLEKWQQGANKNNLIYYQVPSKFKKAFERLSEGNLKTITQNIADNLFKMSNDEKEFGTRGVLASLSGEEMKFIPVLGKYKTDFTDQSYDVWQSLLEYGMSITKAKMFEEKLPVFDTLIDQLEKNPPTEDASKLEAIGNSLANKFNLPNITETIKGKGTNTLQAVRDEIAKGIYEEFSKELGTFMGVSDVKLTNTLLGVAGTTMMLGKVANWTVNALSGNIQVLIESAGKRYFNTKDVANAKLELGKRTKDVLEDVSKLSDKSLIGQLTDYFDPMKGEFMDELGNKFSWSKRTNVQKILFSGKIFGEWEMQMTTFLAMLKSKKVKRILPNGTTIIIDLYDAFEKGTDGIPVLKEGVQFTEKELMAYSFKIQGVNKLLNGSYAKIDQTKIEKYSLGKAAFFMKKYLVPLFLQRFGEFRLDLELQDFREGHYRIFYKTLLLDLKRLGIKNIAEIYAKFSKTPDEGGYTDFQKEGIRKTLTEFAIITMILVALPLLGYGDDDDDSDTAKYAQYIALKLKREVGLFTPLAATQELTSLIERPFIAVGAASNIIDLGASILKLPLNVAFGAFEDDLYYQRKTALWDEGDSKILSLALKTAGLQVAITNPEQLLQSYKYSIR